MSLPEARPPVIAVDAVIAGMALLVATTVYEFHRLRMRWAVDDMSWPAVVQAALYVVAMLVLLVQRPPATERTTQIG